MSTYDIENDRVKLLSGPLKHYQGYIKKIDQRKQRAKVLFKFNDRDHFIDLSINVLKKDETEFENELLFYRYVSQL